MIRPIIEARFYETYYYASVVRNILENQSSHLRHLNEFYESGDYLFYSKPFPRVSALHSFLEFIIDERLTYPTEKTDLDERRTLIELYKYSPSAIDDMELYTLAIEIALRYHDFEFESFIDWLKSSDKTFADADSNDICDYLDELRLCGPLNDLLFQSAREVFYVLFGNRRILMLFNQMMAHLIADTPLDGVPDEYQSYFLRDGVLKRVKIPDWVQRAVFFRDRGMCVSCGTDLSGLLNIWGEDHFDHIVPLAMGGLNDVTNIQLMCANCNLKKGGQKTFTTATYEDWYPLS